MFGLFRTSRNARFDPKKLSLQIRADIRDVDPDENYKPLNPEEVPEELPQVETVGDWFIPRVTVTVCLDIGDGWVRWVTKEDVSDWKTSQSELVELAIENLNTLVSTAKLHKLTSEGGIVYSPLCEGATLSNLILADRLLSDFNFKKENVAAVIPNRDTYYFCDRASPESLELLKFVRDTAWDDEDCLSKHRITKSLLVADEQAAFGWAPLQQLN